MSIQKENSRIIILGSDLIKAGKVISVMTETVYGLLGNAENNSTIKKIFNLKKRPEINPLIVHVSSISMAKKYAVFNNDAISLAKTFWPGPLTLVLEKTKKSTISPFAMSGLNTIALRIPDSKVFLEIIRKSKKPIAAPSANKSGYISSTKASHVMSSFGNKIELIIDSGQSKFGLESTILDLTRKPYKILRQGIYDKELINQKTKLNVYNNKKRINMNQPSAPGLLKKHYSPKTPIRLNAKRPQKNEVFLGFGTNSKTDCNFNLSKTANLHEAAYNLFDYLIKSDQLNKKRIAVAPIPNIGIGVVINERLTRAKGN